MKRILLAGAAAVAVAVAAPAFAADLPAAAPMSYKAPAYAAAYSWTGFYIGANLGGGFSTASDAPTFFNAAGTTVLVGTSTSTNLSGVIGGGQLGYNWQAGRFVFGLEADFDGSGERGSSNFVSAVGTTMTSHQENWFSTVRGRLGYAPDRWLFYVTGGVAFENLGHNTTFTPTGGANIPVGGETVTRTGYVVGGGVETALWGNWTGGVEYLYIDTGNFNTSLPIGAALATAFGAPTITSVTDTQRFQNNVIRAKLNLRF
jgi:outer membrane immunogenic protein